MAAEENLDEPVERKGRGKLLFFVVLPLIFILLMGGGYLGAAYFMQLPPFEEPGPTPEEIAAQKVAEAQAQAELTREIFIKFPSNFTFNMTYNNRQHSAQVDLVLVVDGTENEKIAKKHLALLSSTALAILADESYNGLLLPTGRERLKLKLLDGLRNKMTEVAKAPIIEQVLYTDFVMQ